ncbi:MAG: DUF1360 domain-containing protein [Bacteroidales bacterium]
MKTSKTEKVWNILSMVVFVLLLIVAGTLLIELGIDITRITWGDLILLSIATYRMIRLLVYDRIFKLVRDFIRSFEGTGLGDSLKTIITCPWCAGVWISLFNVAIFYLVPFGQLFIYVMSIAGIATFLQLGSNIAGLVAENKQMDVREKREKTGFRH